MGTHDELVEKKGRFFDLLSTQQAAAEGNGISIIFYR